MKYKTIDDFNVKGKTVLVRADLNSEISNKQAVLSDRIIESAKTIEELITKGAKVIVIAHQGRKGKDDFTNLKQHAELLNQFTDIKFIPDVIGEKAVKAIKNLKEGEAILLDNIRSLDSEEKVGDPKKNEFLKTIAPLVDIYLNDSFSVSHREQTSIVGFPRIVKQFGVGRVMQRELENLEKLKALEKDALYILGGSKPEDNIKLMKKKNILTCGVFGHVCLIASGVDLGAQNKYLESQNKLEKVPELKKLVKAKGVQLPLDLAVKMKNKRVDLPIEDFPSEYEVFDIGPETIELYKEKIRKAKAIFMKGTAGFTEDEQFAVGTKELIQEIIDSKVFCVMGGGHTTTALRKFGIPIDKIGFVSLSGGALLAYVAGEKLPGIEILK